MDINPNKSLKPLSTAVHVNGQKRLKKSAGGASVSGHEGLTACAGSSLQKVIQDSLDAMPDVRRQLVEVGRELAEDANYPSADELDDLGRLALRHFANDSNDSNDSNVE